MIVKDYSGAIEDCVIVITLDPKQATAYNNRGVAEVGLGNAKEGLKDLLKARELGHESGENHYYTGKAKYMLGDKKAAAEEFAKACAQDQTYKNKPYK